MLPVQQIALTQLITLINASGITVALYEHQSGTLVLSATTIHPGGVAYFTTNRKLLNSFLRGAITLQDLYEKSPSIFIEITHGEATSLYLRFDLNIVLSGGN